MRAPGADKRDGSTRGSSPRHLRQRRHTNPDVVWATTSRSLRGHVHTATARPALAPQHCPQREPRASSAARPPRAAANEQRLEPLPPRHRLPAPAIWRQPVPLSFPHFLVCPEDTLEVLFRAEEPLQLVVPKLRIVRPPPQHSRATTRGAPEQSRAGTRRRPTRTAVSRGRSRRTHP